MLKGNTPNPLEAYPSLASNPLHGEVAEWSIAPDLKSGEPQGSEGSNPSLSARWAEGWDENSFGEPEGRTDKAAGLGPSGLKRSVINPSLSARWAEGWDENSFGEPEGRTGKADRPWAAYP
ncbi:MAG: hypothetical protein RL759_1041 [Verrucomicrobiota bacterium]